MANPWDPFPLPTRGDEDKNSTFQGVGFATSQWEFLEFRLSRLYSVFVDQADSLDAIRTYGAGRIFKDRLVLLKNAANQHFVRHPAQRTEVIFERLVVALLGFADRRNEVAHGVVYPAFKIDGRKQYALIPPYHLLRKHNADGAPTFAYTHHELELLGYRLLKLSTEVEEYWKALAGPKATPPIQL